MKRKMCENRDFGPKIAFRQKFANVRRIIDNDLGESELIIGYDKGLDNPNFKEVDY